MEEKKPNGGNLPTLEVVKEETLEVAGKKTTVKFMEDGTIVGEHPADLEGDELATWKETANKELSALAKANQKGFQANRKNEKTESLLLDIRKREDDLSRRELAFKEEKSTLEKQKSLSTSQNIEELTMEILGIQTRVELKDIQDTEGGRYIAAVTEALRRNNQTYMSTVLQSARAAVGEEALILDIKRQGFVPSDVLAYAKLLTGVKRITPKIFEAYLAVKQKKSTKMPSEIMAESGEYHVDWVPQGKVIPEKGVEGQVNRFFQKIVDEDKKRSKI